MGEAKDNTKETDVWHRDEPDSPCQNICLIDRQAKICIGCYRSAEEIATWSKMSAETRQTLRAELPKRAERLRGKRSGRGRRRRQERDLP